MFESNSSVLGVDETQTVWGQDAHQVWRDLAARGAVVRTDANGCPMKALVATPSAVDEMLHRPDILSSNPNAVFIGSEKGLPPIQFDPPEHGRYRRLFDPLFGPKRMNALIPSLTAMVNNLIDEFIDAGSCDFSVDFAGRLPSAIFLELLGLPSTDLEQFIGAKDAMIRPPGATQEERTAYTARAAEWVFGYFHEALEQRRNTGGDDLLCQLLAYENDGKISREESLNASFLLIAAGLDTVTDTLECAYAFLASSPSHRKELAEDPSVVQEAVEELLRYTTVISSVPRISMVDGEIQGCPIAKDEKFAILLGAYNSDPQNFPDPDTVDFHREANRHFAFGAGPHRCLGSNLARAQLRVALSEWHRRIPDYWLPEGHTVMFSPSLREIAHLPLLFPAGGAR
ncbi:MAG: cytochrome [Acidimicrobiia bacterium]|nr:cytochrome [Acidimicrobiia bacterium]